MHTAQSSSRRLLRRAVRALPLIVVCVAFVFSIAPGAQPPDASFLASDSPGAQPAGGAPFNAEELNALSPMAWGFHANLPTPMVRGTGVFFPQNGKFYVMGGRSSDAGGSDLTHPIEYDPYTNTWTTKTATYPDNQVNNMACGVVEIVGVDLIACVGGSAAGAVTATARMFSYNPLTDSIGALASDAWPGAGTAVLPGGFAVMGNTMYIVGGFNINVGMTNQTWVFDASAAAGSRWTQKANYPVSRGYIPMTAINGILYTGGGSDYPGGIVTDSTASYRYNPGTNLWSAIAQIPRATAETRAVEVGGKMWVLGGGRDSPNPSTQIDVYDPVANSWSQAPPMVAARRNFAADAAYGGVILAGGYAPSSPTNTTDIFRVPTTSFVAVPLGGGSPGYRGTSGTQTGRINRFPPASSCGSVKSNPGLFTAAGSRVYDAYPIKNTSNTTECVDVTVGTSCSGNNFVFPVAYLSSFNPASPSANWLADSGSSPNPLGHFSFLLQSGATAVLVVHEVNPGFGCSTYTVAIRRLAWRVPYDTNGDIATDRTVFRPSTGVWYTLNSAGAASATAWGASTDVDVMGDYDGDGRGDITVWRPSTGTWYVVQSSNGVVRIVAWGAAGDIPLHGDIEGDGKEDLIVFRPSTGTWYVSYSSGGFTATAFGASGDQPLVGDFDSDQRMDLTVFRPSNGVWYTAMSGGGFGTVPWGAPGDIPVAGNFDGDGKADQAVFRPGTGQWFVNRSGGTTTVVAFGASTDIPVSGDWDSDGLSDFTVFRPSTGTWYTQFATGGFAAVVWGVSTDKVTGRQPGT